VADKLRRLSFAWHVPLGPRLVSEVVDLGGVELRAVWMLRSRPSAVVEASTWPVAQGVAQSESDDEIRLWSPEVTCSTRRIVGGPLAVVNADDDSAESNTGAQFVAQTSPADRPGLVSLVATHLSAGAESACLSQALEVTDGPQFVHVRYAAEALEVRISRSDATVTVSPLR
jgi:hypothetical protein